METNNPTPAPQKPSNYLVLAILSTVFCCLPTGIASIVYAAKVNELYARGEYAEAESASKNAKLWGLVGVGIGVVGIIIYIAFFGFAIFAGAADGEFNF